MVKKYYKPVWEGYVEARAVTQVHSNMWRLDRYMEHQDAMQEARLVFLKLAKKYKVETEQQFLSLFSMSLKNKFTDLAKKSSSKPSTTSL